MISYRNILDSKPPFVGKVLLRIKWKFELDLCPVIQDFGQNFELEIVWIKTVELEITLDYFIQTYNSLWIKIWITVRPTYELDSEEATHSAPMCSPYLLCDTLIGHVPDMCQCTLFDVGRCWDT